MGRSCSRAFFKDEKTSRIVLPRTRLRTARQRTILLLALPKLFASITRESVRRRASTRGVRLLIGGGNSHGWYAARPPQHPLRRGADRSSPTQPRNGFPSSLRTPGEKGRKTSAPLRLGPPPLDVEERPPCARRRRSAHQTEAFRTSSPRARGTGYTASQEWA